MGSKYREEYKSFVTVQLGWDETRLLDAAEVAKDINAAVERYSIDNPRRKTLIINGDGGFRYTLPGSWEKGFSRIEFIEWPGKQQRISKVKYPEFRVLDNDGNGEKIHFLTFSPSNSDNFAVHYTISHEVTSGNSSIPDTDFHAVGYLAAHFVAMSLAGKSLKNRDSNFGQDIVNFRSLSDEYRKMAKDFFQLYKGWMGLPEKGPKAADQLADLDVRSPWRGNQGYLTHFNR